MPSSAALSGSLRRRPPSVCVGIEDPGSVAASAASRKMLARKPLCRAAPGRRGPLSAVWLSPRRLGADRWDRRRRRFLVV